MKKLNVFLVLVVSIFLFNIDVKAEDLYVTLDTEDSEYISEIGYDTFNSIINDVLLEYKNNYMYSYPRYFISVEFSHYGYNDYHDNLKLFVYLKMLDETSNISFAFTSLGVSNPISLSFFYENVKTSGRLYDIYKNGEFVFNNTYEVYNSSSDIFDFNWESKPGTYTYSPYAYYISNFDLYLPSLNSLKNISNSSAYIFNFDNLLIPTLSNPSINSVVSFDNSYLIEPYYLYDTNSNINLPNTVEINLNDYAYVALSLKDYNQEPFSTNMQVKGNYCLTPVYNYGMTERKDILSGSQVQRCSPYYNDYTLVRTYITESDLKNNAIYYLKAYDTSKDNYVKVDTSVFDITYITEEEKDNPYVTIGNKTYPTIPYDNLTDTSTKSEDEGYNSGASCAVGDFNCMSSSSSSSFSDLFDKPLEILKTLWSSITNVFGLVTFLISLLPSEMATFLFLGFTLAIVIGLIKMIL